MKLDIDIKWDSKFSEEQLLIPYNAQAAGLEVEVNVFNPVPEIEGWQYLGKVSSKNAAEGFVATLASCFMGFEHENINRFEKLNVQGYKRQVSRIREFSLEQPGLKRLVLERDLPEDVSGTKKYLEGLKKKHYIDSRKKEVNDIDYWEGFMGAGGMYEESFFGRGNPGERTWQLACELGSGFRTKEWPGQWNFPGQLSNLRREDFAPRELLNLVSKDMKSLETYRVVGEINEYFLKHSEFPENLPETIGMLTTFSEMYRFALSADIGKHAGL